MTWIAFLLGLGLTVRLTRMITADAIAAPLRALVIRRFGPMSLPAEGVACGFCVSVWIAAVVTPLAYFFGDNLLFVMAGAAAWMTYLSGIAATWIEGR